MSIASTLVNGAKYLIGLPSSLLWRRQDQSPVQNVLLNSNGEEVPREEGVQAPKRRRVVGEDPEEDNDNSEDLTSIPHPSNGVMALPTAVGSPDKGRGQKDMKKSIEVATGFAGSKSGEGDPDTDSDDVTAHSPDATQSVSPTQDAKDQQAEAPLEQGFNKLRLDEVPTSIEQTTSTATRHSRRYQDMPEEWRNDMDVTRQVYNETYNATYGTDQEATQARKGHSILHHPSSDDDEESRIKFRRSVSAYSRATITRTPLYENPRDFFKNEAKHSIPGVGQLKPSNKRIAVDIEARKAREEKERQQEEARLRREADARLAIFGLRKPRAPFITPLSQDWEAKVTAASQPRFKGVKTCAPESVELQARDFARILPDTAWLNDNCIQAATQYGADYINKAAGVKIKKDTPKCVALNSFFWSSLVSSGVRNKERMLKRVWGLTPQNILDVESIIIPINEQAHWTFILIRPQRRELAYVDSFHQQQPRRVAKIREFLEAFLGENYDDEEWKEVSFTVPSQTNGYDCGMFVITNSILLALGLDPSDYKQDDLPLQRHRIVAMILNGGFHGDFDLGGL